MSCGGHGPCTCGGADAPACGCVGCALGVGCLYGQTTAGLADILEGPSTAQAPNAVSDVLKHVSRFFDGGAGRRTTRACRPGETPSGPRGTFSGCVCGPRDTACQERYRATHGRGTTTTRSGGGARTGTERTVTIPSTPTPSAAVQMMRRLNPAIVRRAASWVAPRNAPAAPTPAPTPSITEDQLIEIIVWILAQLDAELGAEEGTTLRFLLEHDHADAEAHELAMAIVAVVEEFLAALLAELESPTVGDLGSDILNVVQTVDRAIDPIVDAVLPAVPFVGQPLQQAHRARMRALYPGQTPAAPAPKAPAKFNPAALLRVVPRATLTIPIETQLASMRSTIRLSRAGDPGAQARMVSIKDRAAAGDTAARKQWKAILALSEEFRA